MRIVYGINSEGMGHATRSQAVIERLVQHGHDVHIFTSDRSYDFFSKKYDDVHRIKGFHLIYDENRLDNKKSVSWNIKHFPDGFTNTLKTIPALYYIIQPNVIISDFEIFTAFIGKAMGIPVIAANNISIIAKTKVDMPAPELKRSKRFASITSRIATIRADWYVIPTFFKPRIKGKNVILTSPVVREAIVKTKPKNGKHILVYQTSPTCLSLLHNLKNLDETFLVYGFGERPKEGNLRFMPFNDTQFAKDLASAKAVITGGGFSLISEALYLKKPILSVPLVDHFEQIMNGHYLRKLGYGDYNIEPTPRDVEHFLNCLPEYRAALEKYNFDPADFARTIENLATQIAVEPSEKRLRSFARMTRNF